MRPGSAECRLDCRQEPWKCPWRQVKAARRSPATTRLRWQRRHDDTAAAAPAVQNDPAPDTDIIIRRGRTPLAVERRTDPRSWDPPVFDNRIADDMPNASSDSASAHGSTSRSARAAAGDDRKRHSDGCHSRIATADRLRFAY
jgi:hypothetical protein